MLIFIVFYSIIIMIKLIEITFNKASIMTIFVYCIGKRTYLIITT